MSTSENLTLKEVLNKAGASALRGGTAGACAMGANVACLMWMRTTVSDRLAEWRTVDCRLKMIGEKRYSSDKDTLSLMRKNRKEWTEPKQRMKRKWRSHFCILYKHLSHLWPIYCMISSTWITGKLPIQKRSIIPRCIENVICRWRSPSFLPWSASCPIPGTPFSFRRHCRKYWSTNTP